MDGRGSRKGRPARATRCGWGMERLVHAGVMALLSGLVAVFVVIGSPLAAGAGQLPAAGPAARAVAALPAAAAPAGTAGSHQQTVVTFAWGGGNASQMPALPLFRKYRIRGTYYVPSGLVCFPHPGADCSKSQYLTLPDVRKIAAGGNEIGGLTVSHVQIKGLPTAEATREICNDRVNLTRWGFRVSDFAYPYAVQTPRIESLVRQCGYNSGLSAGETRGARACPGCIYAEAIPPADPMVIRAPVEVNASSRYHWTPATFERIVSRAQRHGGGWIVFLLHDICPAYCRYGVTEAQLRQVLSWVHRRIGPRLQVKTVRQVIGGQLHRAIEGPAPRLAPGGGVANGSLADLSRTGYPSCFQPAGYGRNTASFSYQRGGGPHGYPTESLQLTSRRSGDAKLLMKTDLGQCAPPVTAGHTYQLGAYYKSSSPQTQIDVYYRNQIGAWRYWVSSPRLPRASGWRQASWTTPPAPPGATGIAFGLAAGSPGTVTTTAYTFGPAHPGRLHLIVGFLVLLALSAPLLGWRLWHGKGSAPGGPDAAVPGGQLGQAGSHVPTSSP